MLDFSPRQRKLLDLINRKSFPIPSQEIASVLNVTPRTIRNDIKNINIQLNTTLIESIHGGGYLIKNKNLATQILLEGDVRDIKFDVLKKILDEHITNFYKLSDSLYISETKLVIVVSELNELFKEQKIHCKIIREHNELVIDGDEFLKRKLFNTILKTEVNKNKLNILLYKNYFRGFDIEQMLAIVREVNYKFGIKLNDFSLISLVFHIGVLIDRIQNNQIVDYKIDELKNSTPQKIATELALRLDKDLKIKLPTSEIDYVYSLYNCQFTGAEIRYPEIMKIVSEMIKLINKEFYINFGTDKQFIFYLSRHVMNLHRRATNGTFLVNPMRKELKNKFPFIYNISVFASAIIQKKLKIKFTDDEIGYIALHFLSSFENTQKKDTKVILIINPYGISNERLVKMKIATLSNFDFKFIIAPSIFGINNILRKEVNLIVSPEAIELDSNYPKYIYTNFLDDNDLTKIGKILSTEPVDESFMLKTFFRKELFFGNMRFKDKVEVLNFLSERMTEAGVVEPFFKKLVLEREELSSTAFENSYSIPHSIRRVSKMNAIAVCCIPNGVKWDTKVVKLVFLLALTNKRDATVKLLFSNLVDLLDNSKFVKQLSKSESFSEFMEMCDTKINGHD